MVGSWQRKEGRGEKEESEQLWRRLLLGSGEEEEEGEGEEEEGERHPPSPRLGSGLDTGLVLAQSLQALGFPYVSKLRGSFDHFVDFLLLSPGFGTSSFSPPVATEDPPGILVERHDPSVYELWRRRAWAAAALPPSLYTTAGFRTPSLLPASNASPLSDNQWCWPPGMAGLPLPRGRRLTPKDMLRLAETLEAAESKGHSAVVRAVKEMVAVQKKMIEVGVGDEGEEEDEGREAKEQGKDLERGGSPHRGGQSRMQHFFSRKPKSSSEDPKSMDGNGQGEGREGGEGGMTASMVVGKAALLLDKADRYLGHVVERHAGDNSETLL